MHYIEKLKGLGQSPPFSWQKRLIGILFRKKRQCFSAAVRGESVLSVVFTMVFVCIHADLPSHWKCSLMKFYMVCLCSKYAEIKGADLCIWFSDVISAHLEHFPMFYVCVRVCSKYGLGHFGKFDVLSSCPQLYIHHPEHTLRQCDLRKRRSPFVLKNQLHTCERKVAVLLPQVREFPVSKILADIFHFLLQPN